MFRAKQLDNATFAQISQELINAPMQEVPALLELLRRRYPGVMKYLSLAPTDAAIDWPTAVRAKLAFAGSVLSAAVAAKNSGVGLWNPAGSNQQVYVRRMECSVAVAAVVGLYLLRDADITVGPKAAGNVISDTNLGDGSGGTNAAYQAGGGLSSYSFASAGVGDPLGTYDLGAAQPYVRAGDSSYVAVIPPGQSLFFINATLNAALRATFEYAVFNVGS